MIFAKRSPRKLRAASLEPCLLNNPKSLSRLGPLPQRNRVAGFLVAIHAKPDNRIKSSGSNFKAG